MSFSGRSASRASQWPPPLLVSVAAERGRWLALSLGRRAETIHRRVHRSESAAHRRSGRVETGVGSFARHAPAVGGARKDPNLVGPADELGAVRGAAVARRGRPVAAASERAGDGGSDSKLARSREGQ